ncbi:uncharacterized protein LOC126803651 [Argentina anserina]|uniref:uncharacterized protein LOC126803651 n=1 Tax=Argentina anserina TaxID=57926 RepID=UPI0021768920|nr:uncharacterized protein LOC126803651 [Potentilla anserina]
MSESDGASSHHHHHDPHSTPPPTLLLLKQVLVESLKIILRNPQTFISIFALTTLPLSLLLFSLSLSSHPIKSHVYHLESLARLAPTRFEARQVWKESRDDAVSLLRIKLFYFLPSYLLSLLASVAAVTAASAKSPSLRSSLAAARSSWTRPLATSICVYALLAAYALIPSTLAVIFASGTGPGLFIRVLGSGVEVYLMAVTGLGLVVSIVEERFGWDAIRVGSGLMAGKRLCGWVLSGLLVMVTAVISRKLEEVMDGQDLMERSSTGTMTRVVMGIEEKFGWVVLYGLVVLFGYVVTSVFYCECRKRHVIESNENENDSV